MLQGMFFFLCLPIFSSRLFVRSVWAQGQNCQAKLLQTMGSLVYYLERMSLGLSKLWMLWKSMGIGGDRWNFISESEFSTYIPSDPKYKYLLNRRVFKSAYIYAYASYKSYLKYKDERKCVAQSLCVCVSSLVTLVSPGLRLDERSL
jgi:hypothetical protein